MSQFQKVNPDFDLLVANFGAGTNSRVTVFRHPAATIDGEWIKIPGTNILTIGRETTAELRRYFDAVTVRTAREQIPGGLSGRTAVAIRQYLDLYTPRTADEPAT